MCQKHDNQYFGRILGLTVKLYLTASFFEKTTPEHAPIKEDKDANFVKQYEKFIGTLGLPHDVNQCVNEFWSNLFHTYFEYAEVDHLYKVQMTSHYREVLDPNKTGTAHEKKESLSQTLISIGEPELKN